MGLFDGSGGGFDPSNWIDHNIYESMMEDDSDYDDSDYDDYDERY